MKIILIDGFLKNMTNYRITFTLSLLILFLVIVSCGKKDINYYDKEIEKNPNDAELFYKRGKISQESDCNKAINDFNKAIELNYEKSFLAYKNRGKCYIKIGELEKALEDLSNSIRLNPQHADSYMERGYLYSTLLEFDKSNEDFNMAYSLDDEFIAAKLKIGENYFNKGKIFFSNRELSKALEYFDKSEITFVEYYEMLTKSKKNDPEYGRLLDKVDVMKLYYYDLLYLQSVTLIELEDYVEAGERIEHLKELNTKYSIQCDSLTEIIKVKKQKPN